MKTFSKTLVLAMVFVFSFSSIGTASGPDHWVYEELPEFKQLIHPLFNQSIDNRIITPEEWKSVHTNVLNDLKLDDPIQIGDWATMLKFTVGLPEEQTEEWLQMYVYGLSTGSEITREDAVGGLVKLLTYRHISGSAGPDIFKASEFLEDLDEIDERQKGLVQIAAYYGLLDGSTITAFRPKDLLTNAEAVSILYRVLRKLSPKVELLKVWPQDRWSFHVVHQFSAANHPKQLTLLQQISNIIDNGGKAKLSESVSAEVWHALLEVALTSADTKNDINTIANYTIGLSEKGSVTRDKAVAEMMWLLLIAGDPMAQGDASEEELKAVSQAFEDLDEAFDRSKLAMAYHLKLISGYPDKRFHPKKRLTNEEAVVLAIRFAERLK